MKTVRFLQVIEVISGLCGADVQYHSLSDHR